MATDLGRVAFAQLAECSCCKPQTSSYFKLDFAWSGHSSSKR